MLRGQLYRVVRLGGGPTGAPKSSRVFVVVSRQILLESRFSSAICAPVFTTGQGLSTQVAVGPEEGLKHASWIMCDNLVSLRKSDLTNFVGTLPAAKLTELNQALRAALDLHDS